MNTKPCPVHPAIPLSISIIAFSFAAIFVKWSDAPAAIIAMYRLVFACFFLIPLLLKDFKQTKGLDKRDWGLLLISGFFLGMHFLFWFASLKYTTVASSTIIMALEPVVVMLGAFIFFRERTSFPALASMFVAITGAVLLGWGDVRISGEALFGDFLSLIGTVVVCVYMLVGQNLMKKMSPFLYSFIVFLFAAFVLFVYNLIASHSFSQYPLNDWGVFVLLGIVPTLGHVLHNWLLKYLNATTISMSILGEPVGASILAYFLLDESMTGLQLIGGLLAFLGVGLFLTVSRVPQPKAEIQLAE